MVVDVPHQPAEAVPQEETDREPGRVRRQAQNVKGTVGIDAQLLAGQPLCQIFQGRTQGVVRYGRWHIAGHESHKCIGINRIRTLRPADNGGIADDLHVVSVRQQMVQGGGVGKGCVLAYRRVVVLLPPIGAKGRRIERHQRRTSGLGVPHAFDGGMGGGDLILTACDKALHPHGVLVRAVPIPLPRLADDSVLVNIAAIHPEQKISARADRLVLSGQGWVLHRFFRLPGVEERQYRSGSGGIHAIQYGVMQACGDAEAVPAALRLPLLVNTQQVGGVVPQEVGCNANSALHRRRQDH